MTVPATTRRAGPFSGNSVATSFPFTFKVFAAADLQVVYTSVDALESVLVLDSDYSITLNPDQDASPGGSVTYPISGSPLAVGERITVVGAIEYEQTTDLPSGGAYRASTVEDALDRATIQIQQVAEEVGRSLRFAVSSSTGSDSTLPPAEPGAVLAWNSAGTALQNVDPTSLASIVAYADWNTDVFDGTGARTEFILTADPGNSSNCDVSISGVTQVPGVDYTVSGKVLTFTSAPPTGTGNVCVRYGQALPQAAVEVATYAYTAAGGETVVSTSGAYVAGTGNLTVFLNGLRLHRATDYTETTSSSITFVRALLPADEVQFVIGNLAISTAAPPAPGWVLVSDFETVQDAVSNAFTGGKWLYWDDDYTVTTNVANFHSVRHFGPGTLTRGADVWRVAPIESTVLNLYVDPAGSATNDGLTALFPLLTIQAAFNIIKDRAPLTGRYTINLAAGTYTENVAVSSATMSDFPIDLRGPTVAHPGVPTAIIQAASTSTDVVSFSAGGWFRLYYVKLQGATTAAACTVNNARVTLTNCHSAGCLIGVTYLNPTVLTVDGGIYTGLGSGVTGGIGFQSFYNAIHDIGGSSAITATQVTAFERGLLINEGAQGHLDYTQVTSCGTGLNIKRGAGACNTDNMTISGCTTGLLVENNGWFNNGIIFSGNTVNVKTHGGSPELSFLTGSNAARTLRLVKTTNVANHTGTVAETLLYTSPTIPDWVVSQSGHTARVTIYGSCSTALTAGTVINFYLNNGADIACGSVTIPLTTTDFKVELLLWHSNAATQRAFASAIGAPSFSTGDYATSAAALKDTAFTIRAKAVLANIGNSILFGAVHLEATYGG